MKKKLIGGTLENPQRTLCRNILGGAKVSDKIEVIPPKIFLKLLIKVINRWYGIHILQSMGLEVGKSYLKQIKFDLAKVLELANG